MSVYLYIHFLKTGQHTQINQDENAQLETYPDKQTPMLNWGFCFDHIISPHIYQLEGIFISLCNQMAYT